MIQLYGKTLGSWALATSADSLPPWPGNRHASPGLDLPPQRRKGRSIRVEFVELDTLLAQSDVISINIRASEKTRGLISRGLWPGETFLHPGEHGAASIVDIPALIDCLRTEKLAAAALDVFDQEPLPRQIPCCLCQCSPFSHNSGMTPKPLRKEIRWSGQRHRLSSGPADQPGQQINA